MNWSVVVTTFGLICVAELGDKTQLAVLAQTCKYGRPWAVFLGASLALTAVTALGAAGGQVLGAVVSPPVLQGVTALAFVAMGLLIAREAAQTRADRNDPTAEDPCTQPGPASVAAPVGSVDWKAFGSTFGLLFVAEMGDKTQLAVLSLAGKRAEWLPVFAGGALALATVTAVGAIGGQVLCRIIPRRLLLWLSAVAFLMMGALIGFGVL